MGQVGPRDNLHGPRSSPFSLHLMIDTTARLRLLWPVCPSCTSPVARPREGPSRERRWSRSKYSS